MTIKNHSITADEYVINAHLETQIRIIGSWEDDDIERLLSHVKLDSKHNILREIVKAKNKTAYLSLLKQQLEGELENE